MRPIRCTTGQVLFLACCFLVSGSVPAQAYPRAKITNKTKFTITSWGVKYASAVCKNDKRTKITKVQSTYNPKTKRVRRPTYDVAFGPGETWTGPKRGVCLITKVWAKIKGKSGYVKSYKSSGTGFSEFHVIGDTLDTVGIYSKSELDRRKVGAGCSAFAPCGGKLTCHPVIQECYNSPRKENQPCMAGYECGSGLHCEAGSHKCRKPAKAGESCHATRPCGGKGMKCQPFLHKCFPGKLDYNNNAICSSYFDKAKSIQANRAGQTQSYGFGGSMTALSENKIIETGFVYGPHGEYGCYGSTCSGIETEVIAGAAFGVLGFFKTWPSFAGKSEAWGIGGSAPLLEAGYSAVKVRDLKGKTIGEARAFTVGGGLVPAGATWVDCDTTVNQVRGPTPRTDITAK